MKLRLRPLAVIIFAIVCVFDSAVASAALPWSHEVDGPFNHTIESQVEVGWHLFNVKIEHSGDRILLHWSGLNGQEVKTTKLTLGDFYASRLNFHSNSLRISDVFIMDGRLFLMIRDNSTGGPYSYITLFDIRFQYQPSADQSYRPVSIVISSLGALVWGQATKIALHANPDVLFDFAPPTLIAGAIGFSTFVTFGFKSVVDYIQHRRNNSNRITANEYGLFPRSLSQVPTIAPVLSPSGELEDVSLTEEGKEPRLLSSILLRGDCRNALKVNPTRRWARFL